MNAKNNIDNNKKKKTSQCIAIKGISHCLAKLARFSNEDNKSINGDKNLGRREKESFVTVVCVIQRSWRVLNTSCVFWFIILCDGRLSSQPEIFLEKLPVLLVHLVSEVSIIQTLLAVTFIWIPLTEKALVICKEQQGFSFIISVGD